MEAEDHERSAATNGPANNKVLAKPKEDQVLEYLKDGNSIAAAATHFGMSSVEIENVLMSNLGRYTLLRAFAWMNVADLAGRELKERLDDGDAFKDMTVSALLKVAREANKMAQQGALMARDVLDFGDLFKGKSGIQYSQLQIQYYHITRKIVDDRTILMQAQMGNEDAQRACDQANVEWSEE